MAGEGFGALFRRPFRAACARDYNLSWYERSFPGYTFRR